MGKKGVVPSAKAVNGRGRGMGTVNVKKTEPKTVNVSETVSKEYAKSIDTKEQERVSKLKPGILKDDYFIGRYKDADAETVQKSLVREFSNAKDASSRRSILKEIGIVGDVINFRKSEGYADQRRKYEKSIYDATVNVLSDGKTTFSSLSPAEQRTAKNAIGIEENIYGERDLANKELSRFDFSKMTSGDIEKLISSYKKDAQSGSYAKSQAARYKVEFLESKFFEKKAEEETLQYKSDEDFIRKNFGGVSYGFVERSVKNLKTEKKRLVSDVASLSQAISMYNVGRAPKGTDVVALRTELAQKQKRLNDVNEQLPVLERYEKTTKEKMEEENNRVLYGSIEKSADFSEKSKPDIDFWNSTQNKDGHALYGYINDLTHQNGKSYRYIFSNYDGTLGHSDWDVYKYLSETEKRKYNYLYNSGRYAAAQNYLATLDLDLSKRRYEKDSAMWEKYAKEHPILESVGTVVSAPWTAYTSLGAVAYDAKDVMKGEEIDPYSGWHRQGNKTDVTRSTVTENIDSDFGKFMYGVSMSIGDNIANMAVGSALGVGASAAGMSKEAVKKIVSGFVSTAMGSTSASASIVNNKKRGLSDKAALGLGLAQGITEVLTEKYSIEAIMKEPKTMMLGILRGMAAEGSEELASGVITTSLDYLVTGSDSEISKLIADYKEKGYSDKGAVAMALFTSLGEQALAGAVSGGIMSGTLSRVGGNVREDSNDDGPDILYQIEYDAENVPFVVVENDILEGLDTKQKEAKVKDVLKERFQRGVHVGNNLIRVNKMTRNEVVNSKYSQTLKRNNPELYDAKLNALTETEDVLKASRNYVNEEMKHARKDNVTDFARGTVNLRIGNKDYKAEIVVGTTIGNNLVLYDVVGLDTAVISDKKTKSFSRADVVAEKSRDQQSAKNSYEAQSPRGSKAKQNKSALRASASIDNIPQNAENSNKNLSDFDKVIAMGDNDYAETVRKRSENADVKDDVLSSIESVESHGKSGITYDDMISGNITEEVRTQKENFEGAVGRAGFKVVYATDRNVPKGTIGYVDFSNREIYISPEHFSESLLNHELTHVIDRGYDGKYVKNLISFFKEEMSDDWNNAEQAIRDKYEKIAEENPGFTYSERTIEAETLAEMCEKFSTDKYIKNAANMKTGTIRQIAVMFRYMWSKMLYHFRDNSEARKMKIASMKWQMALYRAMNEGAANGGDASFYDLVGWRKDGIEVYETSAETKAMPYKERRKAFVELMENEYRGRTARFVKDGKKYYAMFDADDVQKNVYGDKHSDDKGRDAKLNVGADGAIFDLVENSKYVTSEDESGKKTNAHKDVVDWDYYEKTVQIDDVVYDVYVNVRNKTEDSFVYSVHLRENTKIKAASPHRSAKKASVKSGDSHLYNSIISQTPEKNNKNISTDDDMLFAVADDEVSADTQSVEYETPRRRAKSAEEILDEIDIIDELLSDESVSAEEKAELRVKKKKLERSYADKRRSLRDETKKLDERVAEREKGKVEDPPPFKYEEAVKAYREKGDTSGLPDKRSAKMSQKYYAQKADELLLELGSVEGDLMAGNYGSEMERVALEERRDALKTQWREAVSKNNVMKQVIDVLDEIDTVARPNHTWVRDISADLSDNQNILTNGLYITNDVERNFRHFFGKYFKMAYEKILKPLYESKKKWAEGVEAYVARLNEEVVSGLGIYAGSRESAAVMWLGEGKRPLSKRELVKTYGREGAKQKIAEAKKDGQSEVFIEYSFDDCKKEFGEDVARNIQKATEVFRKMYDELIADVNKTRAELYPNNPDKLVKKRKDYFHHFQEMSKGFEGLRNILNTNIGIDPMLVGTSEHTKPKSKWQAYMQERTGNHTEYDAVAGFLDYISAAQYSIHIDPNIVNIRSLAYDLASAKAMEGPGDGNSNANVFIGYLQKYANHLAGKTVSHGDRGWIDAAGRTSLAVLSWLNNMTKASAVLGNLNTVLTQFTNVLNMIGKIEHQSDAVKGVVGALAGIYRKGRVAARYNESGFLKERFLDKKTDSYKFSKWSAKKILQTPGHFASWLLGFADEVGTRITWNAGYNEAVRKGVDNPVQYADNFTRACVAGRGIGEVPLVFQSQVAKLFLPFRVEVLNNLNVQQDILFGKDDDGKSVAVGKRVKNMMQFMIWSSIANILLSAIKSDDFDPIDEAKEGAEENGFLGGVEAVLRDYADGIGDPVVFDPIYDIVTGIYQGINEGESAGGKVGRTVQRTVQNIAGDLVSNNPFSTLVIGTLGADPEDVDKLFNGRMYSPGGLGMPLAGNAARALGELMDEDYLSAAVAIAKGFVPMGTQIDRSIKGVYDYKKGYATTEAAYERMATPLLSKLKGEPVGEGDLKYLIEPRWGNAVRSALFGPGAFSGESDAFYNDETRQFTEKEQAEILSKSDYDSRKVTFDEILAGRVYNSEEKERKTLVAEEFFRGDEDSILYEIYSSGEDAAVPYRNMGVSASFTDDKTDKKYKLKLSAKEAEKITDEMCTVIAKRFDRANESDVFSTMTREEQVKYLDGVKNAEYEFAKISALHDKGKMSDEDFFRFETKYKKCEAERDRALYVDDVSLYVEHNVADTVGQYATYSDVEISKEGYEQLTAWSEYASTRKADEVDKELMRLSNATDSSINIAGNPYGIINYTKNKVEYKISMPDNKIYALCDEVDKAVRSGLSKLFATTAYLNASAEVQKDMVSSVKRKVRDNLRDSYKARYKSVKIDDFDKIINMK